MELRIAPKNTTEPVFPDLTKFGWFRTEPTHIGIENNGETVVLMAPALDSGYVQMHVTIDEFWLMATMAYQAARQFNISLPLPEQESTMDEQEIEQEILAKNLTDPRLRPDDIDSKIVDEDYHVFPGTTLTVCCLTLENGATVTGESACVSESNFNAELGRKIARDNARNKIWQLEGYLLKQRLSEG